MVMLLGIVLFDGISEAWLSQCDQKQISGCWNSETWYRIARLTASIVR